MFQNKIFAALGLCVFVIYSLNKVEHFLCSLYSRYRLIAIQTSCLKFLTVSAPCNNRLAKRIRFTTGRNSQPLPLRARLARSPGRRRGRLLGSRGARSRRQLERRRALPGRFAGRDARALRARGVAVSLSLGLEPGGRARVGGPHDAACLRPRSRGQDPLRGRARRRPSRSVAAGGLAARRPRCRARRRSAAAEHRARRLLDQVEVSGPRG